MTEELTGVGPAEGDKRKKESEGAAASAAVRVGGTPILWHSNAPWVGTGYGTQTALFGPLIAERLGLDVAFSAFYGLKGSRLGWRSPSGRDYIVYPGGRDIHGNDVLGAHAKHWFAGRGGMVLALTDPWVLHHEICMALPMLAWTPVDHDPLMPRTHGWLAKTGAQPIAMSLFGKRIMEEAGHEPLYVPHGFDPNIFQPGDRDSARTVLGLPSDAFVVGMVAANKGAPSRKGFAQALDAFAQFKLRVGNDAILYLHTQLEPPDGENLPSMCESLKLRPFVAEQYGLELGPPVKVVATTMRAFDVLLNPSWGEGFGVPLIEAQACGTPCITTDFSSMPEVAPVAAGNWAVSGQRTWTGFESWQQTPNTEELVEALVEAYEESAKARLARRKSVAKWALDSYSANEVTDRYWDPALQEASARINWGRRQMRKFST